MMFLLVSSLTFLTFVDLIILGKSVDVEPVEVEADVCEEEYLVELGESEDDGLNGLVSEAEV